MLHTHALFTGSCVRGCLRVSIYLSVCLGAGGDAGGLGRATVLPGYHPMQVLGEMLVALDDLYKQNSLELTKPFPTQA